MRPVDLLIEALEYAQDDGTEWWEVFDSKADALATITATSREELEEHEIAQILAYFDNEDIFDDFIENSIQNCFKWLKKSIKDSIYDPNS